MSDPHSKPLPPSEPGMPDAPSLAPESTTATLERPEETKEPGDDERYSHYVRKDRMTRSLIEGGAVVALCGKIWIPTRDPKKYPICPTCKAIYDKMGKGDGTWPFGPNPPRGSGDGV